MPDEYLSNTLNWILPDAQQPPHTATRTILLTSPKQERFKEFAKVKYVQKVPVTMPLVDAAELPDLRTSDQSVLTDTPIATICQSVDRLPNGTLFTVRSTGTPIVHRLSLDQPVRQSIAASFNRTTNMQYANSQPVLELAGHNHRLNAHRYVCRQLGLTSCSHEFIEHRNDDPRDPLTVVAISLSIANRCARTHRL